MKSVVICAFLFGVALSAHAAELQNAGFESGDLTNWAVGGSDWSVSSTESPHGGTYTAVNTSKEDTGTGYQVINQDLPVSEGDICEGGFYVRGPSGTNSVAYFELQFLDGKGNVIEQYQSELTSYVTGFDFRGISSAPAPKGSEHVSVRAVVYHAVKPAVGTTFVFDDAKISITPNAGAKTTKATDAGKKKTTRTSTRLKP